MSTSSASPDVGSPNKPMSLESYVGFDTIAKQKEKKLVKRGFTFNIMVVGRSGLGKSTLVNTLFAAHLLDSKGLSAKQTTEVTTISHVLQENGIQLRLSITDTPGFGDLVNNENCWESIMKYIKDQYSAYLRKELTPQREKRIPDTRLHVVLYFIQPSGHALLPLDIAAMKKIAEVANVVPVIAKADSLTVEERQAFKSRIKAELAFHDIRVYPFVDVDEQFQLGETDQEERAALESIKHIIPFAVCGSERNTVLDGKTVRGRRTRFGVVNIEDPRHCEFIHLRDFLFRTHTEDLIESTASVHYEAFRTRQLLALKESSLQNASRPPTAADNH